MFNLASVCQFAGILTIVGALFLIFKQKIYLNAQTKEVMSVELPLIGKLQTNAPALAVFALGFVAVLYPVYQNRTQYFTVSQDITSDSPFTLVVYASATETTVGDDHHFTLSFPLLPDPNYQPHLLIHSGNIFSDVGIQPHEARNGKIDLKPILLQAAKQVPVINAVTSDKPAGFK